MKAAAGAPAEPFFLKADGGQRFCLYHPPAGPARGALLYVHPFAEELNRARRMAALQARAFAAAGHAVLQIDLAGCGDSSGDFGDARWELWKADLAQAAAWLRERTDAPLRLWGLRLGALLALDYARTAAHPVAGALLADGDAGGGTAQLRAALLAGEALEIAGYDLDPHLARALDALDPLDAFRPACPVDWIEAVTQAGAEPSPGAARAAAAWCDAGVDLRLHPVHSAPFWTTTEITENAAWLETGTAALEARLHGH